MGERLLHLKKRIDRASVAAIVRCLWLMPKAAPYRLGTWAGKGLGVIAYLFLRRERTRALAHLGIAFPDRDQAWIRRTARRSFMHLGMALFEAMLMTPGRMERILREFRGAENLQRALARNKGVVFVTGHLGNWELLVGMVARRFPDSPITVIAAPIEPEAVNDMVVQLRGRMGSRTLLRGRPGAARDLIRVFRENRILGILIDQDTDVEGAFVDFMGRQAWTPTAAASMAVKFGAPLIFGYNERESDGRYTVTVEGPLELVRTGDAEQDIITNTAMLTKKIEERIRRNPEQWVWMHRRWRRQP